MVNLAVPNTLGRGLNNEKDFFVQIVAIDGLIELDGGVSESDFYSFTGLAGELINIDTYSNSLTPRFGDQHDDYVDTILRVYDSSGILVPYYGGVAENDDQFEPTDSSIVDLILPADDTYYVEVDTFRRDPSDPLSDPMNPDSPLNENHPANPLNLDPQDPDYLARLELYERFVDTVMDADQGRYQLILYKFREANPTDDVDDLTGNGGTDELIGGPGDSFELVMDVGLPDTLNEGDTFQRTITVDDRGATSWTGTADYGDGTVETLSIDATGTFTLSHIYVDDGFFTVSVTVNDDIGQTVSDSVGLIITNADPTPTIDSISALRIEGTAIDFVGLATDPAGANDTLTFAWDFGDTSTAGGASASHTYADNGTYTVELTVTDEDGGSAMVSQTVIVDNVDPTPVIDSISPLRIEGTAIDFAGLATDPAGTNDMLTYAWDFGDTSTASGANASHTYADNGTYVVELTVTDEDGVRRLLRKR